MVAGRPREFDKENALEAAMLVFWRNGYPGTSMADLTRAMAINKPSLYAAYGNKEQLFMAALEQYINQYSSPIFDNLLAADQSLEQRLTAYLQSAARLYSRPDLPAGCMMANSACESAGDGVPQSAQSMIANLNQEGEQRFVDFFAQEQALGNLADQSSPRTLAQFLMSITSGMAVLSRSGVNLDQIDDLIEYVVTKICSSIPQPESTSH